MPKKLSAAPSNASDSASVTSSIKDQDNFDDLHDADIDTVSVSTDTSDHDTRLPSYRHLQQDETDGKGESPIEVPSCRIMPPDILSETPYLSKHSIGIQVEDDSDSKTIQALKEKGRHLHELVKQRTELCWQLQDQIDEDSLDFISASVMILSVVHKVRGNVFFCLLQCKILTTSTIACVTDVIKRWLVTCAKQRKEPCCGPQCTQ